MEKKNVRGLDYRVHIGVGIHHARKVLRENEIRGFASAAVLAPGHRSSFPWIHSLRNHGSDN